MKRRGIRDNGQWTAEPFAFKAFFKIRNENMTQYAFVFQY